MRTRVRQALGLDEKKRTRDADVDAGAEARKLRKQQEEQRRKLALEQDVQSAYEGLCKDFVEGRERTRKGSGGGWQRTQQ